jgi:hypothetical protein
MSDILDSSTKIMVRESYLGIIPVQNDMTMMNMGV